MDEALKAVVTAFQFTGTLVGIGPWGDGHINDTYRVDCDLNDEMHRYILQRINTHVFSDPVGLVDNIARATNHIRSKLVHEGCDDVDRRVLSLIPAHGGDFLFKDSEGEYWRAYKFIENAWAFTVIEKPEQAYEGAKAFGKFQSLLADFPEPRLNDTIPNFHHTRKRFDAFLSALEKADSVRVQQAEEAIVFVKGHENMVDVLTALLEGGELRESITHNDTKLNNVMLDDMTGEGICVLDLDTVMPGLALYDFGDMVRFAANPATEDERDLATVIFDMDMFELLVKGYLETAGNMLSSLEIDLLGFSSKLMAFEVGIRFLTDFLSGDTYFKTYRPGQNLDRARCQFTLMASMEEQDEDMRAVVEHYRAGYGQLRQPLPQQLPRFK